MSGGGEASLNGERCTGNVDGPYSDSSPRNDTNPKPSCDANVPTVLDGQVGGACDDVDVNEIVLEAVPPVVGMSFKSMLEVDVFYKKYAKSKGFAVVRVGGSSNVAKERINQTWRCECYGSPDAKIIAKSKRFAKDPVSENLKDQELCNPRRRKSKKCNCTAKIYASVNECRHWIIREVVLDHLNHDPKPKDAKLVKAYRMQEFTSTDRSRVINGAAAGGKVGVMYGSMANERGGYENMPFTQCDMRHVLNEERRRKMSGGDFNALLAYFGKLQRDNSNFYHVHRVDSGGTIKDVLWVDARSMAAYEEFSDVVCFDTTYLTNQYSLPFANFIGVNHHGQSILFGCALISNEDSETFEWVFREWLLCMKGKAPGGILTDQAAAMRRPLEKVMPDTKHRWCIWHITKKLPYKFGSRKCYKEFKKEWLNVVYNSLNEASFERRWKEVVSKYGLENDEWLQNLFAEKHMWVPSFMTDHFWAGMRSTQRVESINSFFDQFVDRNTSFAEFGEKYINAVEKRIMEENEADHKEVKFFRNYSTGFSVERFFKKIYTSSMFRSIQKECEKRTYCMIDEVKRLDDKNFEYLMEDRVWIKKKKRYIEILTDDRTHYTVSYNCETKDGICECKKFETDGIICRHLITLFYKVRLDDIPDKYVLRRWRKDVVRKHSSVTVSFHDLSRTEQVKRRDRLVVVFEPLSQLASKSEVCTVIMLKGMATIEGEITKVLSEDKVEEVNEAAADVEMQSGVGCDTDDSLDGSESEMGGHSNGVESRASEVVGSSTSTPSKSVGIKDPVIKKKRGRPVGSRFKAISETGWSLKSKSQSESCTCQCDAHKCVSSKKKGRGKGKCNEKKVSQSEHTQDDGAQACSNPGDAPRKSKRIKKVSFVDEELNPEGDTRVGDVFNNANESQDYVSLS